MKKNGTVQNHLYPEISTMKTIPRALMALTIVTGMAGLLHPAQAETLDPRTGAVFSYQTRQQISVELALNLPTGEPAALSFYSGDGDDLRLLENAFTDSAGHYSGTLRLPAHETRIVVIVTHADGSERLELPVIGNSIVHADSLQ